MNAFILEEKDFMTTLCFERLYDCISESLKFIKRNFKDDKIFMIYTIKNLWNYVIEPAKNKIHKKHKECAT